MSLYGKKGAFGVVSSIGGTFSGINNYLEGYLPSENIKFREHPVKFKTINDLDQDITGRIGYEYSSTMFKYSGSSDQSFELTIDQGTFSTSEITLLIGENGTGKSTMIKILAGHIKINGFERPELSVSIKEQEVYIEDNCTVKFYLQKQIDLCV